MIDMPSRGMKSCVSLVTALLILASTSPNREAQAQATAESQEAESYPQMGKSREIMLGPDTWFRFGLQAQVWLNYQQSPNRVDGEDGGYAYDMFLRRARLLVVAQFLKNLSGFFLLDSPNLGRTAVTTVGEDTVVSKGFAPATVQDLFATLKVAGDAFTIEGGLFIPGFSANGMQSTTSFRGLDVAAVAAVVVQTATSVLRDVGLQAKGYLVGDHLEYRLAVVSGLRQGADGADPAGRNSPLVSGRLQYHLFDTEKGYVYSGYTFGKKRYLAVGGGFQFQKASDVAGESLDAYSALSAGVWGNWPLSGEASPDGGDELAFIGEVYRYDGGETFVNIAEQNDLLVEAAYYNKGANASLFARFEMQQFADDAVGESGVAGNKRWFGGGIKYFLAENSFNFTLAYQRIQFPDADDDAVNATNQFTLQMQAFYF
jgi:hypothetical protein